MLIGVEKVLSVIIPAYNEEGNIFNTAAVTSEILKNNNIEYELVFVNDGSADKTWDRLCELSEKESSIVAVNFSRNFGKESAIFAGLKIAAGDACVVMDCDLQHPPETIIKMYNIWENNDIDIVEARKADRGKENPFYRFFAKLFYSLLKSGSGIDMKGASDFKLMDRRAVDALNAMPERLTFFRAMSGWVGFKTERVYFEVQKREIGQTKWSLRGLVKYAISSITSFSSLPMQLVTFFGLVLFIIALVLGADTLYNKLSGNSEEGFSTVILLQLITSSIIMFSLGIIGYYLSKIYEEIKNRPRYIVGEIKKSKNIPKAKETNNEEQSEKQP
ncbi:MAG: glycosyltransferase family 2 protein [Oscillospiraceae bacterium]|jgi:dolichol-phosphate mannosyltransferase